MRVLAAMCEKAPLVVILGATGAGKSQLALELAQKFGGEIISADAMQMYKGLDIITNKVTPEEQKIARHHMIDILDPLAINTVVDFKNKALPIVEKLLSEGKIPFLCGGTNYYIESLLWKVLVDETTLILSDEKKRKSAADGGEEEHRGAAQSVKRGPAAPLGEPPDSLSDEFRRIFETVDVETFDFEQDDETVPTEVLHEKLKQVDPRRAECLHPKERRKIWRSLQVWQKFRVPHSELISSQGGKLGGGLRFPSERVCVIEVWSRQDILDERCNRRVDKMIQRGMVDELVDFHTKYYSERSKVSQDSTYKSGIFQSIGFKEFHSFLTLPPEEKESPRGKEEFSKGVELLKIATRQYSRKQAKWMKSRFLMESRESPAIYRVDSSTPELWRENCYLPAVQILQDYIAGRTPQSAVPMAKFAISDSAFHEARRTYHCDVCKRDFLGDHQYKVHLSGKRHRNEVKQQIPFDTWLVLKAVGDDSRRLETAKLLKNSFALPLTEILGLLDQMPCQIAKIPDRARAESLVKCLGKRGIVLEVTEKPRAGADSLPARLEKVST